MSKIAYITSGKNGIHRFTYNELIELDINGIKFILCLTQLESGSWMPLKNWEVLLANKKSAVACFSKLFFFQHLKIIQLLMEALKYKVIPYFLMALSFYHFIKNDKEITSIHCQMGDNKLYIGYFLKKLLHKPLTVTVHAHELYQRKIYDNNQEIRRLFSYCDRVITISDFNKKILSESFISEDRIYLMRLFPDIDYQHKVKDKKRILVVANWAEKKGYDILFQAIKEIYRTDFVLWVVGGSYHSENSIDLNHKIKEYNIEDKVELFGRQYGVVLDIIFSSCDIFCLPSYTEYYDDGKPREREGIPVALMEAMAWGKPVISTKHAGIPELVEEILVEERNVDQLKEAIVYLLDHPEKWAEIGDKNKRIIEQQYSKDNINILINVFKKW